MQNGISGTQKSKEQKKPELCNQAAAVSGSE